MAVMTPQTTNKPLVYISVLNWYNYEQTINCLHQLERLDYEPKTIIVVDNASPNDSAARIRAEFPHLRLIQAKENLGYAAGHRHTVDLALAEGAELVWLVNTDVTFDSDALSALVDAYNQYGDAIYGSLVLQSDDPGHIGMTSHAITAFGRPELSQWVIQWGNDIRELFPDDQPRRVANVSGCSILIPAVIVRRFGFMDSTLFLYAEERDYCFRLSRAGIPVYVVPSSRILHANQASTKNSRALHAIAQYYLRRNQYIMLRRHYGWRTYLSKVFTKSNVKFVLRFWATSLLRPENVDLEQRFAYLALIHGVFDRRGKTVSPEDYL